MSRTDLNTSDFIGNIIRTVIFFYLLFLSAQNQSNPGNKQTDLPPQMLEINPSHPIIIALAKAHGEAERSKVSALVAEQIMDNALIAAGLVDDPRLMLSRLNDILEATLTKK